ncbi:MAG: TdeIII family type II restriction endonuclease [Burkholderiaceae bacterium]|nr:TdeIII family type II restriction endonuclease [Burkholderiaceae bacterium]
MDTGKTAAQAIQDVVSAMMDRVLQRVLLDDPFIKEKHHANKPLYAALVPDEIFKGSHFERRFVTPFGGVWEKLAVVAAQQAHGHCAQGHTVLGSVGEERLRRIQEVLNRLEHRQAGETKQEPDWKAELAYVLQGQGKPIPVAVVCDIFIHNPSTGKKYAFELKAPLPNSDQTKVSKEKMFKLLAMSPAEVDGAFFALPYNPYGTQKSDYAWTFPKRWFDMSSDPCVLIGNEFWDFIGGAGTYAQFIQAVNALGKNYHERIYREYLGIEPPNAPEDYLLK